jgi:hypothetical protein
MYTLPVDLQSNITAAARLYSLSIIVIRRQRHDVRLIDRRVLRAAAVHGIVIRARFSCERAHTCTANSGCPWVMNAPLTDRHPH